jgi:hypothetical protein
MWAAVAGPEILICMRVASARRLHGNGSVRVRRARVAKIEQHPLRVEVEQA